MPNWHELLNESKEAGSTQDILRKKYLVKLSRMTGRNVVIYYSGWLQKASLRIPGVDFSINDDDKNSFMTVIHKLDRRKGLDLLLHTPGGDMAATESLIKYIRAMFGNDIRAIIPQIAMSGGAMITCACKEIIMGEQSNIGPFDPQINGLPAQAIIEDFKRAASEMHADQKKAFIWQPILQKYSLGFFSSCENAINLADDVVSSNLRDCMFDGDADVDAIVAKILSELGSNANTKSHARHIHKDKA